MTEDELKQITQAKNEYDEALKKYTEITRIEEKSDSLKVVKLVCRDDEVIINDKEAAQIISNHWSRRFQEFKDAEEKFNAIKVSFPAVENIMDKFK